MATKTAAPAKKNLDNAEANRMKRLARTLKKQPNNLQVVAAMKTTRIHRKTPTNPVWTASWRRIAQLMRSVTGRFDPNCMSSNAELARTAMSKPGPATLAYKPLPQTGVGFTLGARLQGGAASWN